MRNDTRTQTMATRCMNRRSALLVALLTAGLAACSNNGNGTGGTTAPALQAINVTATQSYVPVGSSLQLTATGSYSDGTKGALATGPTWTSSDPRVATVDANGLVTGVANGAATITATSGSVSGKSDVWSRVMATIAGTALPSALTVDAGQKFFRVTGLTPGALYQPTLDNPSSDVDLLVYADPSATETAQVCVSQQGGTEPESCMAQANASGELWVVADGQWTDGGAQFDLTAPAAAPVKLDGTIAFPAGLPRSGSIGVGEAFYKVTGLTPGASYEVRISNLSADVDVEVYGDVYQFNSLCASFKPGTVDDACVAAASTAGELFVEVDGESTRSGGQYTLSVTAR